MVAARKVPVAPAPASRSNSTQALPRRPAKQKTIPRESTPPSSGNESKTTSTPNGNSQLSQKSENKPPTASSHRFFIFLLSIFAVYAATVCRSEDALSSPVCRGLATYRTHVLEPYIVPPIQTYLVSPIQSAIHHPALAPLHPYAHSASAAVRPRVSAAASAAKARYNAHVVPAATTFWERKVLPTYKTHLYPHARPYILIYRTRVQPAYDAAYTRVEAYVERARPHVHATYVVTTKYSIAAYAAAKPRALAVYARVRPHAIVFYHRSKVYGVKFLAKAVEARREFVDPHVRRIWDKVGEAEATGAILTSTVVAESKPTPAEEQPLSASSVIQASVAAESGIAADVASAAAEAASSSAASASLAAASEVASSSSAAASASLAAASSAAAASSSSAAAAASSSMAAASSAAAAAASAASSSAEAAASPAPPQETPAPEATHTSEAAATTTESETAASAASIIAASLHVPVANAQEVPHTTEDSTSEAEAADIDDFLRDIGLDDTPADPRDSPTTDSNTQEPSAAVGEPGPTEEERLAATAERRADIMGRHATWQVRLDALIAEKEGAFGGVLEGFRAGAVRELAGMFPAEGGVVGSVEAEAGKLMKGVEAYLQKLKGKQVVEEEERGKWGKVLGKVEERFAEKVRNVQGEVHEWYMGVREGEGREVRRVAAEIKSLAEKAQADIGLDYAWLDDVTYQDWQKYHDLMRASERFATTLEAIQNGTHPEAARDVLVKALDVLEAEMQEVISGFLVRLQAVQREAQESVFSPAELPKDATEAIPEPIAEPIDAADPSGDNAEPRVSILPIDPTGEPQPRVTGVDTEHLFVGKEAEAVKRALEGVEVEAGAKAGDHVEL